jgi:hypothetical protein
MANEALIRRFRAKLEATVKNLKGSIDLVQFIHEELKTEPRWLDCMDDYCAFFANRKLEGNHKIQADSLAVPMFAQGNRMAAAQTSLASLILDLEKVRKGEMVVGSLTARYRPYLVRWQALSERDRRILLSDVVPAQRLAREKRDLLSDLEDAWRSKNKTTPQLADLLCFDPEFPLSREAFVAAVNVCASATGAAERNKPPPLLDALTALDEAFAAFRSYLSNNVKVPLALIQVLRWIAEGSSARTVVRIVGNQKHSSTASWSSFWEELYLDACFHGVLLGTTTPNLKPVQLAHGYFGRDLEYVLDPLSGLARQLLNKRLEFGFRKAGGFAEVHRLRRRQRLVGRYSGMQVLDELTTVAFMESLKNVQKTAPDAALKRYVQVSDARIVFRDRYRVNQSVMDAFTILWIDGSGERAIATLELHSMPGLLFRADSVAIGRLVESAFFKELAHNAQALAVFMLAYLEFLGLVLDVITAGISGGLRHVAVEFIKQRIKDKVTKEVLDAFHIENAGVRFVANAGVNMLHAPKLGAPAINATAIENAAVRGTGATERALLDPPATHGRASVVDDVPVTPPSGVPAKGSRGVEMEMEMKGGTAKNDNVVPGGDAAKKVAAKEAQNENYVPREMQATGTDGSGYRATEGSGQTGTSSGKGAKGGADPAGSSSRFTPSERLGTTPWVGGAADAAPRASRFAGSGRKPAQPPVPPRPVNTMGSGKARDFFKQNQGSKQYSDRVKAAIEKLPAKGEPRGMKGELEDIDKMIRDDFVANANESIGRSRTGTGPFVQAQRSQSNAGGRFAGVVNDEGALSLTGVTRAGEKVEFDSIDFARRTFIETKQSNVRKTVEELADQMRRQAQFSKDWNFGHIVWETYEETDISAFMKRLMDAKKRLPKDLADKIDIRNPTTAHHELLDPLD